MALSRPLINEEHLLMGVAHELGNNRAGGVNYIIERPAGGGLPEVIRIVDNDEGHNLPIYITSDEEEEGEVEIGIVDEGEGIPPLSSDDEDEFEEDGHQLMEIEEEEDDDTDDDEDWSDWVSEDSGYDSMYEDEEDFEDDDDDDIRPRSPLIQQFQPEHFWQGWRQVYPPVPARPPVPGPAVPVRGPVAVPQQLIVRHPPVQHQELPGQQVEPPEEGLPSVSQRSEESAPSTSGLSSSTKRSREESDTDQVSAKRPRWNCEERHEESAPSTSGLNFFTNRSREESYGESAPSTSGLGSFTNRRYWPGLFEYPRWADDSDSD